MYYNFVKYALMKLKKEYAVFWGSENCVLYAQIIDKLM